MIVDGDARPVGSADSWGNPRSATPVALHGATGNQGTGGAAHGEAVSPFPTSREDRDTPSASGRPRPARAAAQFVAADGQPSRPLAASPADAVTGDGASSLPRRPHGLTRAWCHEGCNGWRHFLNGRCAVAWSHR